MHVLLVGAGNMSVEYVKVLNDLNIDFTVIGRSKQSAAMFEKETGIKILTGGLEVVYEQLKVQPTHAIVATTLESLEENSAFLLDKGIKHILIEKPASVHFEGLKKISDLTEAKKANCFIAYNRRFYSSVNEAGRLIEQEGGLKSFIFEFTEWSHLVNKLNKTQFQLNNWFVGNSTHVIDAAFFFGGIPKEIKSFVQSELSWHPKGSIYTGAGITEKDILFSYHANWNAPGSWKLELLTDENRYIFRPFEKLHVQRIGSVVVEEVDIEDLLDIEFKPGLYEQTKAFLFQNELYDKLLRVNKGMEMMKVYERMTALN